MRGLCGGRFGGNPNLQIHHRFQNLLDIDPSDPVRLPRLPDGARLGNLLLLRGQKACLVGSVGDEEPGDGRHGDGGETLDEEEDAPAPEGLVLVAGDAVGEGAGEGRGQRGGGGEEADAETDFMAEVEEGEEVDYAGSGCVGTQSMLDCSFIM